MSHEQPEQITDLKRSVGTSSSAIGSPTTSSNTDVIATPPPTAIDVPSAQAPDSPGKSWIAGAVVGPVVGIAIVVILSWFLLRRKRKNNSAQQDEAGFGQDKHSHPTIPTLQDGDANFAQTIARPTPSTHVSEMAGDWQHRAERQVQSPTELIGSTSDRSRAELWQGNYQPKP